MTGRASDSLTARLNLDVLRFDRGEHAEALRDLDGFIDIYNDRKRLADVERAHGDRYRVPVPRV